MPKLKTEIDFPFSAHKIYDMVADVEAYPNFVPNCHSLEIKSQQKVNEQTLIDAEMGVKYSVFSEKFGSNVILNDQKCQVIVQLSSGPIKKLNNVWQFVDTRNGCIANFEIEIEMSNLALRLALSAAFKFGVVEITNAFKQRANQLYA